MTMRLWVPDGRGGWRAVGGREAVYLANVALARQRAGAHGAHLVRRPGKDFTQQRVTLAEPPKEAVSSTDPCRYVAHYNWQ